MGETENRMEFRSVEGSDKMSIEDIARLLKMTYWADTRSMETIKKSVSNSSCYGIYADDQGKLIGFARVISDYATTWYLCDVIIEPHYRHQGLGKELVSYIVSLPEFAELRGLLLTRDAHSLYSRYGFESAEGRAMVRAPQC